MESALLLLQNCHGAGATATRGGTRMRESESVRCHGCCFSAAAGAAVMVLKCRFELLRLVNELAVVAAPLLHFIHGDCCCCVWTEMASR